MAFLFKSYWQIKYILNNKEISQPMSLKSYNVHSSFSSISLSLYSFSFVLLFSLCRWLHQPLWVASSIHPASQAAIYIAFTYIHPLTEHLLNSYYRTGTVKSTPSPASRAVPAHQRWPINSEYWPNECVNTGTTLDKTRSLFSQSIKFKERRERIHQQIRKSLDTRSAKKRMKMRMLL